MPLQTCTKMTRVIASFGSPKKADEVPNAAHTRAAGPADGLKISEKIRPITVTPRIVGRNTTARATLRPRSRWLSSCLLYTSDAADDLLCVDLGGRRIIK